MTRLYVATVVAAGGLLAVSGLIAGEPTKAGASAKPVTFTKDIAPIFQEKCEACHRKDSMAPMSLVTYEEVRPWARSIKERVVTHQMPPWHLDKTVGIQQFQNDRSLSDEQIATIVKWVDSGSPMGDAKDMPAAKQFPNEDEWQLAKQFGQPDLILKSTEYTMPGVSQDQWWQPITEVGLTEPRWVRAVEMRPGTKAGRRITHHAIGYLMQTEPKESANAAAELDPLSALGGGILMEWAVGKQYDVYRPNTGKLLLPGSKIRWDIHYHAVGDQITDHVELAVYLYPKGEIPKYRTYLTMFNAAASGASALDIPPNTVAETENFHVLKQAARLENFQPHMHLRGKAMLLEAILPNGNVQTISYCNNFNFNWMNNYIYAEDAAPVFPKGTIIHVKAWHDNTTAKASNPDPNQWVGWGDRTVDEMAHAWVNVTYISDDDYKEWAAKHKPAGPTNPLASFLNQ